MDFDIFKIFSEHKYAEFWYYVLTVALKGFWARFAAFALLVSGLWVLVKKRNVQVGIMLVIFSLVLTYGYTIIRFFLGG